MVLPKECWKFSLPLSSLRHIVLFWASERECFEWLINLHSSRYLCASFSLTHAMLFRSAIFVLFGFVCKPCSLYQQHILHRNSQFASIYRLALKTFPAHKKKSNLSLIFSPPLIDATQFLAHKANTSLCRIHFTRKKKLSFNKKRRKNHKTAPSFLIFDTN